MSHTHTHIHTQRQLTECLRYVLINACVTRYNPCDLPNEFDDKYCSCEKVRFLRIVLLFPVIVMILCIKIDHAAMLVFNDQIGC